MINKQTMISKEVANKKIIVTREFDAPLEEVWKAWTDRNILDQWWAPKPWKARTKIMDFTEGGVWLYAMVGPDGTETWCRVDFEKIVPQKSFAAVDSFCDQDGNITDDLPGMRWKNEFIKTATGTKVQVEITFSSDADMEKIIEMGFEGGFTSALGNLDELLVSNVHQ